MRTRRLPWVLFLTICLITGCARTAVPECVSTPVPSTAASAASASPIKTSFTDAELMADYEQFWAELEENYPFLPYLDQQGIDTEGIRENYRLSVQRIHDAAGLAFVLRQVCMRLNFFAHLSVADESIIRLYRDLEDNASYRARQPWFALVNDPQTLTTYGLTDQQDAEARSDEQSDLQYPNVETRYYEAQKAVYFHFFTFNHDILERDQDIVTDYIASLGDVEIEHIIFDICGNSGGDSSYWVHNIAAPFGGVYDWQYELFFSESPVARAFYFDTNLFAPSPISEYSAALPPMADELGAAYFSTENNHFDFGGASVSHMQADARRWVLIDEQVYSSSENFAAFCKATGWATLVGRQGSGDGLGVDPVLIRLDNTGLLFRFSAVIAFNPDGTLHNAVGTMPDYDSLTYEMPLQTCLRLIDAGESS